MRNTELTLNRIIEFIIIENDILVDYYGDTDDGSFTLSACRHSGMKYGDYEDTIRKIKRKYGNYHVQRMIAENNVLHLVIVEESEFDEND